MELHSQVATTTCACCGGVTQALSGELREGDAVIGLYLIRWTRGNHELRADILVSLLADQAVHGVDGKVCFVVLYDFPGNAFMVCDHADHALGQRDGQLGTPLNRSDVVGRPPATLLFAALDFIWANDELFRHTVNAHG